MVMSYRAAKILLVAVFFDFFTAIHAGARTVDQISRRTKTAPRAARILLDSLVSLGFLKKARHKYANAKVSENTLVKGGRDYIGNYIKYQELIWDAWSDLRSVMKTGRTAFPLEDLLSKRKDFGREYILGMQNIARKPARQVAALFPEAGAERFLDVGGGPGTYSIEFLKRIRTLKASLLDLPSTVRIAREATSEEPESRRLSFIEGNYKKTGFGSELYDIVLMSHITHDEDERTNRALFRKARRALRPGGKLVVHDFTVNEEKTGPVFGALFSVHMLVYTRGGQVYSFNDYRTWLETAGLSGIRKFDIAKGSPNATTAIIATRAS